MAGLIAPVARLIEEFDKLPGVGTKTAQRLAYHVLRAPPDEARGLAAALVAVKEEVDYCSVCCNITEVGVDPCAICADPRRDAALLCVVEEAADVGAIERAGRFRGRYHVLGGRLAPLDGVGPEALRIDALRARLGEGSEVREVIVATNPSMEGEVTATFLQQILQPTGVRVTRIARGLPIGGDLEYADGVTIAQALLARREMSEAD